MKSNVIFTNDNNVNVKLINHNFSNDFIRRDKHEVMFRKINTYLIKNKLIDKKKMLIWYLKKIYIKNNYNIKDIREIK